MIAVALLYPHQATPVRRWMFDRESPIRIGRSAESDVVLYSSVISRRHLELHFHIGSWWAVNYGKNGTFANGLAFDRLRVDRAVTLCLAKSGPCLHIAPVQRSSISPAHDDCDDATLLFPEEEDDLTSIDLRTASLDLHLVN